jgi:hypothetical protein
MTLKQCKECAYCVAEFKCLGTEPRPVCKRYVRYLEYLPSVPCLEYKEVRNVVGPVR